MTKSAPQPFTSGSRWGLACTASTMVHAPTERASSAAPATSGAVPTELAAAVRASRRVRGVSSSRRSASSSRPSGQRACHTCTTAPWASSQRQGLALDSCSSSETMTSSPGWNTRPKARESWKVRAVALVPSITSSGWQWRNSAVAARAWAFTSVARTEAA